MKHWSLRFRMMFLFCLVVGVLLAGTYIIIYSVFVKAVGDQQDRRLLDTAHPIVADLMANPSEQDVFQLDVPNQYFELLDSNGSALQSSKNLIGWHLHSGPEGLDPSKIVFKTIPSRYGRLRVALLPFLLGSTRMYLAIAVPSSDADQAMASFRRTLLLLWPISLFVTGIIACAASTFDNPPGKSTPVGAWNWPCGPKSTDTRPSQNMYCDPSATLKSDGALRGVNWRPFPSARVGLATAPVPIASDSPSPEPVSGL